MPMIICPICGVVSNPWPDYINSKGTSVIQRLSYCGHQITAATILIEEALRGEEVK